MSVAVESVGFYRSTDRYGFLSNLFPCQVEFEGVTFLSAEHEYQFGKANEECIREWIRNAPHPRLAAIAGHGLLAYDIVPHWNEIKVDRMRRVIEAKFRQNVELAQRLLATGEAALFEISKTDRFWGIGKNGKGQNTLGMLLMELRSKLKQLPKAEERQ